jgi:hypothetical protein
MILLRFYHFSFNFGRWPTWHTVSSIVYLFESSKCFEQLCAHPQEDSCINTTSGVIFLKICDCTKITKVTRIHRGYIGHNTLTVNVR